MSKNALMLAGFPLGLRGYNRKQGEGPWPVMKPFWIWNRWTFEKIIWAIGMDEKPIAYVKTCFQTMGKVDKYHQPKVFISIFWLTLRRRNPQAVNAFVQSKDMSLSPPRFKPTFSKLQGWFGKHWISRKTVLDYNSMGRIRTMSFDSRCCIALHYQTT